MKKYLILRSNAKEINARKTEICDICSYYKTNIDNIFLRVTRRLNLKISYLFMENWKKNLNKYDTIILFDNGYHSVITSYIKRKKPNVRLILWFWNPIIEYSKNYLLDKNLDEIWTYDRKDAEKYHLKFSPQFFNEEIKCDSKIINNDIVFLGKNKGRRNYIEELQKKFNDNGLRTNFKIVEKKSDFQPYNIYLENVGCSKAILDIVNDDVDGLTLRCMEALFLDKKLITNNKGIKDYDFYNANNIFIIGIDSLNKINQFIDSEYVKIDSKIKNKYEFMSWLKRFK